MARNGSAEAPRKKPALQTIARSVALAASLALLNTDAWSLSQQVRSPNTPIAVAAERQSPEIEESWIVFHLATPERSSIREQYINQEVLAALLRSGVGHAPGLRSCDWRVKRGDVFGDFSIWVRTQIQFDASNVFAVPSTICCGKRSMKAIFERRARIRPVTSYMGGLPISTRSRWLFKRFTKNTPRSSKFTRLDRTISPTFRLMNLICGCSVAVNES